MAKRPHPNDDQRGSAYVKSLVVKKAAKAADSGGAPFVADWSAVSCSLLCQFVWATNIQGNSCLLGQTRNGALLTVTLYAGADKATWYFEQNLVGQDELYNFMSAIIEAAQNSPEGQEHPFQGVA